MKIETVIPFQEVLGFTSMWYMISLDLRRTFELETQRCLMPSPLQTVPLGSCAPGSLQLRRGGGCRGLCDVSVSGIFHLWSIQAGCVSQRNRPQTGNRLDGRAMPQRRRRRGGWWFQSVVLPLSQICGKKNKNAQHQKRERRQHLIPAKTNKIHIILRNPLILCRSNDFCRFPEA